MTQRIVTLADGRRVPLGVYVAAWAKAKTLPAGMKVRGPGDDWGSYGSPDQAVAQFRAGMHDRINRKAPGYGQGRKWNPDWQRHALQLAGRINAGVIVREREAPPEFRAKLAHKLYTEEDF